MKKKANPREEVSQQTHLNNSTINNSLSAQRQSLIEALRIAPVTTNQAREQLNIMSPASRIREMRQAGHIIITEMIWQLDVFGRKHKAAKYYLIKSKPKGGAE